MCPRLFCTSCLPCFSSPGAIVGYAAGAAGHRPSKVAYLMLVLVVLLVFIIIDLDRPRRGLIEVDHRSLTSLQTAIDAGNYGDQLSNP